MTNINDAIKQVNTEVTSKQFALNAKDFLRGLLMAAGGAVLTVVETSIEAGVFHFDWSAIGKVAVAAAVVYLTKNYFQPAQVKTTITNDQVDQVKATGAVPDQAAK